MTDLKAIPSPHISDALLKRISAYLRPVRITAEHTLFTVGYEQAKADILEFILREVGQQQTAQSDTLEQRARAASGQSRGILAGLLRL